MKRSSAFAILVAAVVMAPFFASTAATGEAPEAAAATSALRQFSAEGQLVSGEPVRATIVASEHDEGRARAALSSAISRAQSFYAEMFGESGTSKRLGSLKKGERAELSPTAFDFLKRARMLAPQTKGFFDITAPSPKSLFMKRDWRRVILDDSDRSVHFKNDDMELELSRIAPAYACDIMMESIHADGFANASVSAGPVERNSGRDIYTPWDILVGFGERTETGTHRAYRYGFSNVGVATVTPEGLGAGLIDPLNKKQVNWSGELRSVTIIASDAMTATAFALAAYTVGPKYAMKYVTGNPAIVGIMVDEKGELHASKALNINSVPYETNFAEQRTSDGGPNDIRLREREESSH